MDKHKHHQEKEHSEKKEQEENSKLENLKSELEQALSNHAKAEEEIAECKDQLIRIVAESENIRKRAQKQIEDAGKFAINGFSKDLIEVIENLFLALENIDKDQVNNDENFANLYKGVEMTKNTLVSVFEKHGIKRVHPEVKEFFDHNLHQAVAHIPQEGYQDNMIINVMRAGYVLHDRLIKPAMVVVAKS